MNGRRENSDLVCHIIDEEFNELSNDSKYKHRQKIFNQINELKNNPDLMFRIFTMFKYMLDPPQVK